MPFEQTKRRCLSPVLKRSFKIGMPQMANGGLSERWLFKEIGDFHWRLISEGLETRASELADGSGNRLYATFTRVKAESSVPWALYREDDTVDIQGTLKRYGAGLYFGRFDGASGDFRFAFETMSSFSGRGKGRDNSNLVKGQPALPTDCCIPNLSEKPVFAKEYQLARSAASARTPVVGQYRVNPFTDINGVGLLYFAAYPAIADFLEMTEFADTSWATETSVISRDVFYFANSDLNKSLALRMLSRASVVGGTTTDCEIINSDGSRIARLVSKRLLI
jgi:probable biosynthetic protein (TIGR04098 family)